MEHDSVNHPAHYTDGSIEVIDFIEDKRLSYHLSNAVKYIARAGKKDPERIGEDGIIESNGSYYQAKEVSRDNMECREERTDSKREK